MISIQVEQAFAGLRLDKFLCKKFALSFGVAQKIIREKKIRVNSDRVDAAYRVEDGDQVEVHINLENRLEKTKKKPHISAEKLKKFSSWVIFEDENLMAINKPSGLATQGGSSIEISVDDFLTAKNSAPQKISGQKFQLVHRLDKDTSGILLISKNSKSAEFLTDAFRNKTIKKTYLALVNGSFKKVSGTINIPLKKHLVGKNEKVRPDFSDGKEAITEYKRLKDFGDHALLELRPLTGRTHQLRVHCKEIGHPILNDIKYGGRDVMRKDVSKRLCLHAQKIEISDYFGKSLKIETDMPEFV